MRIGWNGNKYARIPMVKKTEPKQCPLGTVLKHDALFSKKAPKTVPLRQSDPQQKGTVPYQCPWDSIFVSKREAESVPFCKRALK